MVETILGVGGQKACLSPSYLRRIKEGRRWSEHSSCSAESGPTVDRSKEVIPCGVVLHFSQEPS